ncbi:phosphatidylinositol kinase, partial [Hamiltosporidium tvaerminnensis]
NCKENSKNIILKDKLSYFGFLDFLKIYGNLEFQNYLEKYEYFILSYNIIQLKNILDTDEFIKILYTDFKSEYKGLLVFIYFKIFPYKLKYLEMKDIEFLKRYIKNFVAYFSEKLTSLYLIINFYNLFDNKYEIESILSSVSFQKNINFIVLFIFIQIRFKSIDEKFIKNMYNLSEFLKENRLYFTKFIQQFNLPILFNYSYWGFYYDFQKYFRKSNFFSLIENVLLIYENNSSSFNNSSDVSNEKNISLIDNSDIKSDIHSLGFKENTQKPSPCFVLFNEDTEELKKLLNFILFQNYTVNIYLNINSQIKFTNLFKAPKTNVSFITETKKTFILEANEDLKKFLDFKIDSFEFKDKDIIVLKNFILLNLSHFNYNNLENLVKICLKICENKHDYSVDEYDSSISILKNIVSNFEETYFSEEMNSKEFNEKRNLISDILLYLRIKKIYKIRKDYQPKKILFKDPILTNYNKTNLSSEIEKNILPDNINHELLNTSFNFESDFSNDTHIFEILEKIIENITHLGDISSFKKLFQFINLFPNQNFIAEIMLLLLEQNHCNIFTLIYSAELYIYNLNIIPFEKNTKLSLYYSKRYEYFKKAKIYDFLKLTENNLKIYDENDPGMIKYFLLYFIYKQNTCLGIFKKYFFENILNILKLEIEFENDFIVVTSLFIFRNYLKITDNESYSEFIEVFGIEMCEKYKYIEIFLSKKEKILNSENMYEDENSMNEHIYDLNKSNNEIQKSHEECSFDISKFGHMGKNNPKKDSEPVFDISTHKSGTTNINRENESDLSLFRFFSERIENLDSNNSKISYFIKKFRKDSFYNIFLEKYYSYERIEDLLNDFFNLKTYFSDISTLFKMKLIHLKDIDKKTFFLSEFDNTVDEMYNLNIISLEIINILKEKTFNLKNGHDLRNINYFEFLKIFCSEDIIFLLIFIFNEFIDTNQEIIVPILKNGKLKFHRFYIWNRKYYKVLLNPFITHEILLFYINSEKENRNYEEEIEKEKIDFSECNSESYNFIDYNFNIALQKPSVYDVSQNNDFMTQNEKIFFDNLDSFTKSLEKWNDFDFYSERNTFKRSKKFMESDFYSRSNLYDKINVLKFINSENSDIQSNYLKNILDSLKSIENKIKILTKNRNICNFKIHQNSFTEDSNNNNLFSDSKLIKEQNNNLYKNCIFIDKFQVQNENIFSSNISIKNENMNYLSPEHFNSKFKNIISTLSDSFTDYFNEIEKTFCKIEKEDLIKLLITRDETFNFLKSFLFYNLNMFDESKKYLNEVIKNTDFNHHIFYIANTNLADMKIKTYEGKPIEIITQYLIPCLKNLNIIENEMVVPFKSNMNKSKTGKLFVPNEKNTNIFTIPENKDDINFNPIYFAKDSFFEFKILVLEKIGNILYEIYEGFLNSLSLNTNLENKNTKIEKSKMNLLSDYTAEIAFQKEIKENRNELFLKSYHLLLRIYSELSLISDKDSFIFKLLSIIFDFNGKNSKILEDIPSYKFLPAKYQLISKYFNSDSEYLKKTIYRLCNDHFIHVVFEVYCSIKNKMDIKSMDTLKSKEKGTYERFTSSSEHFNLFKNNIKNVKNIERMIESYKCIYRNEKNFNEDISFKEIPIPSINFKISKNSEYKNLVFFEEFILSVKKLPGINNPILIENRGSDGKIYKEIIKGKDELRQDIIALQMFSQMNKVFENKNILKIRTYKVVRFEKFFGIVQYLSNTITLGELIDNLHKKKYPEKYDLKKCRNIFNSVVLHSLDSKISTFKEISDNFIPVFNNFFLNFNNPFIYFRMKRKYVQSLGISSISTYILGLGDRHCHNLLIDTYTGEIINIDLNLLFDQARLLKTPETVPFRMTRNLIDALMCKISLNTFKTDSFKNENYFSNSSISKENEVEKIKRSKLQETERKTLNHKSNDDDSLENEVEKIKRSKLQETGSKTLNYKSNDNDSLENENKLYILREINTRNIYLREIMTQTLKQLKKEKSIILSLMTIFRSDPLHRWILCDKKIGNIGKKSDIKLFTDAEKIIFRMKEKLSGIESGFCFSEDSHVCFLLEKATSVENLVKLFPGWQPWV